MAERPKSPRQHGAEQPESEWQRDLDASHRQRQEQQDRQLAEGIHARPKHVIPTSSEDDSVSHDAAMQHAPDQGEPLFDRATMDDEQVKEHLREQLRAYNEGGAWTLRGPLPEREHHLLMDIVMEDMREWARQRRTERRRLRSQLGKREFARRRRRGELPGLG